MGFRSLWKSIKSTIKRQSDEEEVDDLSQDVHYRLMKKYPEVPEWQYLIVLLLSMMFGMLGVGLYPTHTSPVVLVFGIIMPLIVICEFRGGGRQLWRPIGEFRPPPTVAYRQISANYHHTAAKHNPTHSPHATMLLF